MDDVRRVMFRLLAISAIGAALGFAARIASPRYGVEIATNIGWVIVALSIGALGMAVWATAKAFASEEVAEGGPLASKKLIACSLVCYVAGVPMALGLHLAGQMPLAGVLLYVAPLAVALVIGYRSMRATPTFAPAPAAAEPAAQESEVLPANVTRLHD